MKKTALLILAAFLTIAPLQARKVKGNVTAQGAPWQKYWYRTDTASP